MLTVLLLAWALAAGAPPLGVGAVALAVWRPVWFLGVVAAWAAYVRLRERSRDVLVAETAFLQGMAAELAVGASLRAALEAAAARAPELHLEPLVRRAAVGRPIGEVADLLEQALPSGGRLAGAALRISSITGGRAAEVFAGLALRSAELHRVGRERRAATAQVRFSAWLLAGGPLIGLVLLGVTGRMGTFLDFGVVGTGVMLAGVGLVGTGAGWIWWMQRGGR